MTAMYCTTGSESPFAVYISDPAAFSTTGQAEGIAFAMFDTNELDISTHGAFLHFRTAEATVNAPEYIYDICICYKRFYS